jgi:sterol desaturase/sphingolipid hydroxylase (fatty acid hydroxylase superfamily)
VGKAILLAALAAVTFAAIIEGIVLSRRKSGYDWRAFGVSITNHVARTSIGIALPLSIATPLFNLAWEHRVSTVALDSWLAFLVLFFGQEFCYYWYHRASHRVRWFWANHSVHHSPNDLTLAAALRIGVFGKLIGNAVFFVPLVWLGFSIQVVLATLALNLLYQFWIHAQWIPKLGWLENVLNTPSAHRVHHAANLDYLDANYGGVLIIFDRLFGTYVPESDRLPIRYGLVTPQLSYNPLVVETHEWRKLFGDLRQAKNIRSFVGFLLMPPGWQPDGHGQTTEELRRAITS